MKNILLALFLILVSIPSYALTSGTHAVATAGGSSNPTDIVVTPSTKNYGTVTENTSSNNETFTAKNWYANPYKIGTVALTTGTNYEISTDNCSTVTLANLDTCTILAKFSPKTTSSLTDTLSIPYCRPNTITWNSQPAAMTVGDADQTLNMASSTSSGTITYSTTGETICKVVSGPKLQAVGAGSCVVHADQSASDPWCAATQVQSGDVTISAAGDSCTGALLLSAHFENSDTITTGGGCNSNAATTWAKSNESYVLDATTPGTHAPSATGLYNLRWDTGNSQKVASINVDALKTAGTISFDIWFDNLDHGDMLFLDLASPDTDNYIHLTTNSTNTYIRYTGGGTTAMAYTAGFASAGWHTVKAKWSTTAVSGNYLWVEVDNSGTCDSPNTSALPTLTGTLTQVRLGDNSYSTDRMSIDNLKIYNNWQ